MKKILILIAAILIFGNHHVFPQDSREYKYDVRQYILDLDISNTSSVISGNVTINAQVAARSLDTFVIELIDTIVANQTWMVVDSVFVNGVSHLFRHHNDLVIVPLNDAFSQNQAFSVKIFYHGNGADCRQTNGNGINKLNYMGINHTCTFSEPTWSKVWWPCKQVLSDKADSVTFYITTDSLNKSGSNGILKSTEYLQGGKVKYKWVTKYPVAFFLISFTVGPLTEYKTYAILPNGRDSVLLQNLLFSNSTYYQTHLKVIKKTKQLMYLYSKLLGDYPFKNEKYGYSVIGSELGAMENQTMCTIGYLSMDTTSIAYGGPYYFWYVAHELGHQWFGDYVSGASWNYSWFHEGFASYMEYVALQNLESQAKADYWIQNAHKTSMSLPGGSVYVPDSLLSDEKNILNTRLQYKKGASIIHLLRYEINNDSLFFRVLRNFLSAFAYSVATADDFRRVAESTTGIDFTDFFNQWYYGQGYPIFNITWSQRNDTLTIQSNQTTSATITPLFKTHFDLMIHHLSHYPTGDTIVRLMQSSNNNTFKIYCPERVLYITMDPKFWLLERNNL